MLLNGLPHQANISGFEQLRNCNIDILRKYEFPSLVVRPRITHQKNKCVEVILVVINVKRYPIIVLLVVRFLDLPYVKFLSECNRFRIQFINIGCTDFDNL